MAVDPFWNQATAPRQVPVPKKPPIPIVLVAVVQFLKAGVLVFLALAFCGFGAVFTSSDTTKVGLILLSMVLAALLAIAIYLIRSGVLLLQLEKTARRRLMWNIVAGWLIYGTSFSGILFGESPFIASWPNRIVICVLLLDSFLYCCLAFYPDVARAFGDENQTDILP
jgi:hypothetical protein